MKQPLLSSVWSVMLDGKSSSYKIKALEGSKPTGVIIFEFIKFIHMVSITFLRL